MHMDYKASLAASFRFNGYCSWVIFALCVSAGCAPSPLYKETIPPPPAKNSVTNDTGWQIVKAARQLVGTPYRYGGTTPQGFDCSGLVQFAHRQVGISIPRTTQTQLQRAYRVPLSDVQPGDVVFFRLSRRKISHVGIYAGNQQFIHAPSRGKRVSYASLEEPYWKQRIIGAGRLY